MKFFASKRYQRVTNFALAFMLVVSTLTASVPFLFAEKASALPVSSAVYTGIPAVQPATYPSIGFAATSTKELGDRVTLAGSNRHLNDVTFSLTTWACETGEWQFNNCVTTPGNSGFQLPVTVNIYAVNADGTPGAVVATKTQTINAQYRPSADPACVDGNIGKWRASNGVCYNGKAFDVNFDFSAQHKTLPSEVIATVAYNGNYSNGAKALNVSLNNIAGPTVGTDTDPATMYEDSSFPGDTPGLRAANYSSYHLAMNINATPTNVAPVSTFTGSTPADNTGVNGVVNANVTFSDDYGMAGYYVRFWKDGFEVPNQLLKNCMSVPGAFLLGTTQNVDCSFDTTGLANGTKIVLSAQVEDGNGVWANTITRTFTVDTQAPGVGFQTQPGTVTLASNSFNARFAVSGETGLINKALYFDDETVPANLCWGINSDHRNLDSSNFNCPAAFTSLADGTHKLVAVVIDEAGNKTVESSNNFVVDRTAPNVPSNGLPNSTYKNTPSGWNYTWSDESASGAVRYEYQASQNPALTNGIWNSVANGDSSQNPLLTPQIPSVGTVDGTWYWQVRAIDNYGNTSAWSTIWNVTVDTVAPSAPAVTATGVESGDSTNAESVEILWTKPSTDTVTYNYVVWTNAEDSSYDSEANAYAENGLTGNSRTGGFTEGEGTYFVRVQAVDAANNKSPWSEVFSVVYDNTAPVVSFSTPAQTVGNGVTLEIEGTSNDSTSYTLYRSDLEAPVQTGESFTSYDFVTEGLASGEYTFSLVATDEIGNTSEPATVTITVDNTDPVVTLSANATATGNNGTVVLTADIDDATAYTLTRNGTVITTFNGTTYNFNTTGFASGTYAFILTATDENGNAGVSETVTITVDNTSPALTVTPVTTQGNTPTITGTAELGATLVATFNGVTSAVVNNEGTYSYVVTNPLANGTYEFSITATDAAGNSTLATTSVIVAVAAPATEPTSTVLPPIVSQSGVLGANTDDDAAAAEVKGTSTDKTAAVADGVNNTDGKIFGLAWFWWLLIIAALAAIAWWIIGAIRRRNSSEA